MKKIVSLSLSLLLLVSLVSFVGCSSSRTAVDLKEVTCSVGEAATIESLEITATGVYTSLGAEGYPLVKSGNMYVGVKFTVKNRSDQAEHFNALLLFTPYVDGQKVNYSSYGAIAFNAELFGDIPAGKTIEGYYAVEVSTSAKVIELKAVANKIIFKVDVPTIAD